MSACCPCPNTWKVCTQHRLALQAGEVPCMSSQEGGRTLGPQKRSEATTGPILIPLSPVLSCAGCQPFAIHSVLQVLGVSVTLTLKSWARAQIQVVTAWQRPLPISHTYLPPTALPHTYSIPESNVEKIRREGKRDCEPLCTLCEQTNVS